MTSIVSSPTELTPFGTSLGIDPEKLQVKLVPLPFKGDIYNPLRSDDYATPEAYAYLTEQRGTEKHPDGSTRVWNFLTRYPEPFLKLLALWQGRPFDLDDAQLLISLDVKPEETCADDHSTFIPVKYFMPIQRAASGSRRSLEINEEFGAILRRIGKLKPAIKEFSKNKSESVQAGHYYQLPGTKFTEDKSFQAFCGKAVFVVPTGQQGPQIVAIDKLTHLGQMLAASETRDSGGKTLYRQGQSWHAIEAARKALYAKWQADRLKKAADFAAQRAQKEAVAEQQIESKRSQFFSDKPAQPQNPALAHPHNGKANGTTETSGVPPKLDLKRKERRQEQAVEA